MNGFVKYNIDYVIKFGGSILENYDTFINIAIKIEELSKKGIKFLIIPGGGPTDNKIEELDKQYKLKPDTHHKACARAQDQTGLIIANNLVTKNFEVCENFEEVCRATLKNKVPVLLPSQIIFLINPFEKTWDITSDAMAAWFAWLIECKEVIILTNVDGIFRDKKINEYQNLISEITATKLLEFSHTAIDACMAPFLKKNNINSWVLNANFPNRLEEAIFQNKTIGTRVLGI